MSYITEPGERQKPRVISVYVERRPDINVHMFYCVNCRNGVMKYQGQVATMIPGDAPEPFPMEIMCRNESCRTVYSFINWVKES